MMTKVQFTKIINFMTPTPGAGVHVLECGQSHIFKMHYFVKYLILYTQAWIRQTGIIVMMTKEESTKIVYFMTPEAGGHVLGHSYIMNMQYFFFFSCLQWGMDQTI